MNTKTKVWSDDGWDGVYEAACEEHPYEANNEPTSEDTYPKVIETKTVKCIVQKPEYVGKWSDPMYHPNEPIKLERLKPGDQVTLKIEDLEKLDQIKSEGGSRCQNCNTFNEYVADPHYICYSCKNI